MKLTSFTGKWVSEYFYSAGKSSRHETLFIAKNGRLVGKGSNETGSQLTLILEFDQKNNILTGTWHEVTAQAGQYKSAVFHGAVQFILNSESNQAHGMWVGYNSERAKINTGKWILLKT